MLGLHLVLETLHRRFTISIEQKAIELVTLYTIVSAKPNTYSGRC